MAGHILHSFDVFEELLVGPQLPAFVAILLDVKIYDLLLRLDDALKILKDEIFPEKHFFCAVIRLVGGKKD